jgi:hypothetical protein
MGNKGELNSLGNQLGGQPSPNMAPGDDAARPMPEVAAAVAKLRADVDQLKPDHLGTIYALLAETHRAVIDNWRGHPQCQVFLAQLQYELAMVVNEYRDNASLARSIDGDLFNNPEEVIRSDAQADIMLEELRLFAAEAAKLNGLRH